MSMVFTIPHFEMEDCIPGTVVYPPGGKYGPRINREIQLVLLHSGSMEVNIDGTEHKVKPGYAMLILPGQTVSITFSKHSDSWHRWVSLTPIIDIRQLVPELFNLPLLCPISWSLNQLIDLMLNQQRLDTLAYRTLQRTFGLAAIQIYAEDSQYRASPDNHPALLTVKSFIGNQFKQKLDLAHLAQSANISPSHLIRLFREHEGISPVQYLWLFRVERGLELLRTTGLSVGEIANQCGFSSLFHFSRLVKKRTGETPTEIRALFWSGDHHRIPNEEESS